MFEIIRNLSSLENVKDKWNEWCSSVNHDNIYFTFNWTVSNLNFSGHSPRIIVEKNESGDILNIIPMELKYFCGIRILQPVGNDFVRKLPFYGKKLPDDSFFSFLEKTIPHDLIIWNYFYDHERQKIDARKTRWFKFAPELIINLSPIPDDYFHSLDRTMRKNLFRRIRNISRDIGKPVLDKLHCTTRTLNSLFSLNKAVFSHKKYDSIFNHDEFRQFFSDLTCGLEDKYYRLYSLKAGSEILAMRLTYVTGKRLQLRIPGYNYKYRKYSLSHSLLKFIIEDARSQGFDSISFMRGNEHFKYDWNPEEISRYRLFRYRRFTFYLYYSVMLSLSREIPRFWEHIRGLFRKSL